MNHSPVMLKVLVIVACFLSFFLSFASSSPFSSQFSSPLKVSYLMHPLFILCIYSPCVTNETFLSKNAVKQNVKNRYQQNSVLSLASQQEERTINRRTSRNAVDSSIETNDAVDTDKHVIEDDTIESYLHPKSHKLEHDEKGRKYTLIIAFNPGFNPGNELQEKIKDDMSLLANITG